MSCCMVLYMFYQCQTSSPCCSYFLLIFKFPFSPIPLFSNFTDFEIHCGYIKWFRVETHHQTAEALWPGCWHHLEKWLFIQNFTPTSPLSRILHQDMSDWTGFFTTTNPNRIKFLQITVLPIWYTYISVCEIIRSWLFPGKCFGILLNGRQWNSSVPNGHVLLSPTSSVTINRR